MHCPAGVQEINPCRRALLTALECGGPRIQPQTALLLVRAVTGNAFLVEQRLDLVAEIPHLGGCGVAQQKCAEAEQISSQPDHGGKRKTPGGAGRFSR